MERNTKIAHSQIGKVFRLAAKAIQSDIMLLTWALASKRDLMKAVREIIKGLEDCHIDPRKTAPNALQLMSPQPPSSNKKGQGGC